MEFEEQRKKIIEHLKESGYLKDKNVERAMMKVPREFFIQKEYEQYAYSDTPLSIPGEQTISAMHMYSIMLCAVKPKQSEKILEIGTGSGYGACLLKEIVGNGKVITMEIVPKLVKLSRRNIKKFGAKDITVIEGDGSKGYDKEMPYDIIIITAACPKIPEHLIYQLKHDGRMIAPVGKHVQDLILIEKHKNGKTITKNLGSCMFVKLKGIYGYK